MLNASLLLHVDFWTACFETVVKLRFPLFCELDPFSIYVYPRSRRIREDPSVIGGFATKLPVIRDFLLTRTNWWHCNVLTVMAIHSCYKEGATSNLISYLAISMRVNESWFLSPDTQIYDIPTMAHTSLQSDLLTTVMVFTCKLPVSLIWFNFNPSMDIYTHTPNKVWYEITYSFPNFKGCPIEVCEWKSYFITHFIVDVILIHVGIKVNPCYLIKNGPLSLHISQHASYSHVHVIVADGLAPIWVPSCRPSPVKPAPKSSVDWQYISMNNSWNRIIALIPCDHASETCVTITTTTHRGPVTHIYASINSAIIAIDNGLSLQALSPFLNQCWLIVNWSLRIKFQWNFNQSYHNFRSMKCISKCHLQNGGHFVSASMC